jgi:hypothetical protein
MLAGAPAYRIILNPLWVKVGLMLLATEIF